ncbi:MAG: hypothetical protein HFG43_03455 [Lachnospiraceae bacterium]|nr:hypothetical protein [Lachnospiraceae bacterium]
MPAGRAETDGDQENFWGGVILHGCGGDKSEVERYYGMSFEEAIQNGMDSKIVDLDYLMVFYVEEYDKGKVDEEWERY